MKMSKRISNNLLAVTMMFVLRSHYWPAFQHTQQTTKFLNFVLF